MPVYNFNRGFTILHASLFELEFFRAYYIFFFLIIILVNADLLDIIYSWILYIIYHRLEAEFRDLLEIFEIHIEIPRCLLMIINERSRIKCKLDRGNLNWNEWPATVNLTVFDCIFIFQN